MKISKKILAIALAVIMVLSVLPFSAFATEYEAGSQIDGPSLQTGDKIYLERTNIHALFGGAVLKAGQFLEFSSYKACKGGNKANGTVTSSDIYLSDNIGIREYYFKYVEDYDSGKCYVPIDENGNVLEYILVLEKTDDFEPITFGTYVAPAPAAHTHSFTYTANGDTITATCGADGCDLTENKVTLKIVPNPVLYYDDGQPKEASLEGLEAFNAATGKNISTDNIAYYKGDTNVTAQIKAGSGTSIKISTYTARLDVEGKRATVTFRLTAKPTPHTHKFTYNAEGNVITATCTQSTSNMEACDLENKQATLTLNAPLHATYGDGKEANATLTGEIPGVTNPTIHYSKGSATLSSAPTDAGTYTAWCQLGNAIARVEYTVAIAVNSGYTTLPYAVENLVYTGEAQELVTAGVTSTGQIAYTAGTDPDNEPDVYTGGMPYSYSVPKMTDAGTYYVWCKLDGGKNYTSLGAQKIAVVTIAKANPTYSVPTELTATYGDTLSSVVLPEGWTWADGTQSVGDVGTNIFKANFTPADTANYNTVENVDVTVKVNQPEPHNGVNLTVGNDITSNYYVDFAAYTGAQKIRYSYNCVNELEQNVQDGATIALDEIPDEMIDATSGRFVLEVSQAPAQMGETTKIEILGENDVVLDTLNYSAKTYCDTVLAMSDDELAQYTAKGAELRKLCHTMIAYGEAAQGVFNEYDTVKVYCENADVNAQIDAASVTANHTVDNSGMIKFSGVSFVCTKDARLRFYLNTSEATSTPAAPTASTGNAALKYTLNGAEKQYFVEVSGINAADFNEQITVNYGGSTIKLSVLDFAGIVLRDGSGASAALQHFAKTLVVYNTNALAFFN